MKTNKTYGEIADLINKFDEDDKPIICNIETTDGVLITLPVDNFQLFKLVTNENPNDLCNFNLSENEDSVFLGY